MCERSTQHTHRYRLLGGLSGAILANVVFTTTGFVFTVGPKSLWVTILVTFISAAIVLGLHAGLSSRIAGSGYNLAFWLAFVGFIFGAIGAVLIGIFLNERLHVLSLDDRIANWSVLNISTIALGALYQWIALGSLRLVRRNRSTTPPNV